MTAAEAAAEAMLARHHCRMAAAHVYATVFAAEYARRVKEMGHAFARNDARTVALDAMHGFLEAMP